jgi:GrpB-like predicted nucleotidyltransferase (UPF0157 family)
MVTEGDSVYVTEYDPAWPCKFEALAARVRACLGDLVSCVEHVGSTAVPSLVAKPVIDLDVIVATRSEVPLAIERLARIGYTHQGDLGVVGREAFRWPPGEARHHLYLLADGAEELRRHLAFRDAMRADSRLRDEYAALKRRLADQYRNDRAAYVAGKSDFVESVLRGPCIGSAPVQ